eukprot:741932-Hanusia_phi.AAC.2
MVSHRHAHYAPAASSVSHADRLYAGDVSLIPASGPNNNQQQGTQTVTISGTFFPTDCSKGCVFDPPCDTCEMEVTYYVYFGSDAAGCNFEDQDADACQCTAPSGEVQAGGGFSGPAGDLPDFQDLVRDCGWDGHFFRSKSSQHACDGVVLMLLLGRYRCHSIVCQVAPLYGQQPLKIFFKDKCERGGLSDARAHDVLKGRASGSRRTVSSIRHSTGSLNPSEQRRLSEAMHSTLASQLHIPSPEDHHNHTQGACSPNLSFQIVFACPNIHAIPLILLRLKYTSSGFCDRGWSSDNHRRKLWWRFELHSGR